MSLFLGVPMGNLGRCPFTGNCERYWKDGSGNGASLFAGALLGDPGDVQEGSLLGTL